MLLLFLLLLQTLKLHPLLVARVVPLALLCLKVELEDVAVGGLAGTPVVGQFALEAFACDPEQVLVLVQVDSEILCLLEDLLLVGFVEFVFFFVQDLHSTCA